MSDRLSDYVGGTRLGIMTATTRVSESHSLHICMLAPSHASWDPRVVQRESLSLSKKGHQVTVVAMHDESRSVPAGIELLALPMDTLTRCKRIKTMWRVYQISRRRPFDVYHAHEVESLAVGILLKWRTGAELVFDAHECFHFTAARFSTGLRAQIISTLTSRMLRWMSRRAAHVIAVSFTNEKFYREYCGCRRVTIIHNSPPPDSFQYKNKPAEAVRTITHDGYLDESRGQDQILHALAIIKRHMPVKLLVVGQVSERSRASFAQRVKKLGLSNEIEVTGWLPYEQVGITLNRGSIGLVAMQPTPNNYGSLSNKLFNYMSTGQAVVGPKGSDTAEVIRQANCGALADMTDPQALAEAVMPLLADPDHCRQLGMNGRRAIEQKFGWHKMEETLGNIYESLDH